MYKLLCFLALLFLNSCIEDITDDFPIEEKLVVNSILVAEEPIYFEMSSNYQTYPQLRKFFPGKLFLYKNERLIDSQKNINNRITLNKIAEPDSVYSFIYKTESGLKITSSTKCGSSFQLGEPILLGLTEPSGTDSLVSVRLQILDGPGRDYYEVSCTVYYKVYNYEFNRKCYLSAKNFNQTDSAFDRRRLLFSDSTFNNTLFEFDLTTDIVRKYSSKKWISDTLTYVFTVKNISYSYYHYQRTKYLHNYNSNGDFLSGNTSASPVYSNIKGGLGIFGGMNILTSSIEITKK